MQVTHRLSHSDSDNRNQVTVFNLRPVPGAGVPAGVARITHFGSINCQ
jgi:hypothetical protein